MSVLGNNLLAQYYAQNQGLPDGYEAIEYLESTGTQYINTGVNMNNSLVITGKYKHYKGTAFSIIDGRCSTSTAKRNAIFLLVGGYGTNTQGFYGLSGSLLNMKVNETNNKWNDFELKRNSLTVGEVTDSRTEPTLETGYTTTMYLFAGHQAYDGDDMTINLHPDGDMALDIAWLQIQDNGVPVRNFIPCVRKSDGKPGMYDLCRSICPLTGTPFYVNAGTSEFVTP